MKTKPIYLAVLLLGVGAFAWQASAQPAFDSTGDGMLNGTYYFRQVVYVAQSGDAMSLIGNISFDGQGNYNLTNATILDAASGSVSPQAFSATGTYSIAASGEGYITAFNPNVNTTDQIVGLVSPKGLFIGSTTENTEGYNDLFIAAPVGSVATNATLSGSYKVAYFDPTYPGDAILSFSADGNGNIGNMSTTQYVEDTSTTAASAQTLTPTLSGVTYSFSNGAAQLNFGGQVTANNFIGGTEILYITPDGNFVFGGNFNGFDMFVGVRNANSSPTTYQALYYQAGTDYDYTGYPNNNGLDSYFGATNILSDNGIIAHQRLNIGGSEDYVYSDLYSQNGDGSAVDSFYDYWATQDGSIRIGYGAPDPSTGFNSLGINVAFQGPALNPSGKVYVSPVGAVNAASNAPFTAFVSPGEFLTLYGSGLASTTDSASVPFPKNLDGVVVTVNGVEAPVYFVSPNQVSIVVPYITTPGSVAQIQVSDNGVNSNMVTAFTSVTSVGVFTNSPVGGDGIAASERPDFSIISETNPAQVGETISVYLSGMGAVNPSVSDGAAAPDSPLSNTDQTPSVFLYDVNDSNTGQAAVTFSGLAPGFAGLYQMNFTIPSGLSTNDTILDIYSGLDSETLESILPVSDGGSARPAARVVHKHARLTRHKRNPAKHLLGSKRTASEPRS